MSILVTIILSVLFGKAISENRPDYGIPLMAALVLHTIVVLM